MGLVNKIQRSTDFIQTLRLAISCSVWAVCAIVLSLLELRRDHKIDDPYWAADGKSEDIRALKH